MMRVIFKVFAQTFSERVYAKKPYIVYVKKPLNRGRFLREVFQL